MKKHKKENRCSILISMRPKNYRETSDLRVLLKVFTIRLFKMRGRLEQLNRIELRLKRMSNC